ncbi:MAG TPA: AsnC family transcriptional regulator [Bacteroidetes bacterium]|mgnify:CR=1 FL=1|nr:AsnC family transcriptional regulator [Bacteroidota bacterium]
MCPKLEIKSEKLRGIDDKDIKIINLLVQNARIKLTKLSKKIGLSIDSTRKRLKKLEDNEVILRYTVQPASELLGWPLGIYVHIKYKNASRKRLHEFIDYCCKSNEIVDVISTIGAYDLFLVILAKDMEYAADDFKAELREKFGDVIADWSEMMTAKLHKVEEYRF